jgi:hypothetical protein
MPLTEPDLWVSHIRLFSLTRLTRDNHKTYALFAA